MAGKKALEGIKVLEASYHLNGPFAGRLLGELGATVVKIEPPGGEPNRKSGPMFNKESSHFVNYNANKKFVTLNLKHREGKKIFIELVRWADVFLENFRPGVMDKLGLGYEELKKSNPGLIYASSTGYGYNGPYKDEAAYDTLIQGMTGMMDATGFDNTPPIRSAPAISDIAAGTFCALGILAALLYKKQTGLGQRIDIAMYDVAVSQMIGLYSFAQGGRPVKYGNWVPVLAPYDVYKARDGYVAIIIGEDSRWNSFLNEIGRGDMVGDSRFNSIESRLSHHLEIDELVTEWLQDKTVAEAVEVVRKAGGAAGPIRPITSLFQDPQVRAREMLVELEHPTIGKFVTIGSALKMSETPGSVTSPGLPLGYNNKEIYGELLGLNTKEINKLMSDGVI